MWYCIDDETKKLFDGCRLKSVVDVWSFEFIVDKSQEISETVLVPDTSTILLIIVICNRSLCKE